MASVKGKRGWAIIHPAGSVELDYFHVKVWKIGPDYKRSTRLKWKQAYRPECKMIYMELVPCKP